MNKKKSILKSFKKSPYFSFKYTSYFDTYDYLFKNLNNEELTVVEIGVQLGGSLFMLRDYFGKKARIIGIDMNPYAKKFEKYGFEIFIGNQADINFWNNFKKKVGRIDILIDDGGHTFEQQIVTVESNIDNMNDEGMIIVEDTHTSYLDGFGNNKYSFINYVKMKIDKINYRFHLLAHKKYEKKIWSIEIFESLIVFRVNKSLSKKISKPAYNKGKTDTWEDFRHKDNKNLESFYLITKNLTILKKIFIIKKIAKFLLNLFFAKKSHYKYFKD